MTVFPVPTHWVRRPSPNHNGRGDKRITAIVLHADAASRIDSSLDWICRQESQVSYHILIGRNGAVYLTVPPERRAWHAGVAQYLNTNDVNTVSLGVCLSNRNDGEEPYPPAQVTAAVEVCALLCKHFGIPTEHITTHALVAMPPGRKTDPKGLNLSDFRAAVQAKLPTR